MRKLILDTNVLMHNPSFVIESGEKLYVPMVVIEELGNLAHDRYSTGYFAREANRILEHMVSAGKIELIPTNKEGIETRFEDPTLHDNQIINTALNGKYDLVTDDVNMRIKCKLLGVKAIPSHEKISAERILNPYEEIELADEEAATLYEQQQLEVKEEAYTYGFAHIGDSYALVLHEGKTLKLLRRGKRKKFSLTKRVKPKSDKQFFTLDALLDERVKLATIIGAAGTGKTLLTLYAGLEQVMGGKYDKIYLIINPVHVGGKDKIGFLPGELHSKLLPYVQAFYDNLEVLYDGYVPEELQDLFDSSLVEVVALDFLRGRTLHNGFIIVDEVQNYSQGEIKTVVTRVADSSKIVLLGDIEQIDINAAPDTSGLFVTASKFFGKPYARHLALDKSERGQLARDAAMLL